MTPLTILRDGLTGLMLTACLAVTHPALAEMISFKAELTGSNEVPANDSKGTGTVTATYDTASKKLTWKGEYSGLTGPTTMAHFHGPAEPFELISGEMGGTNLDPSWQHPHQLGTNADVTVVITPITSPFEGSATLTDAQAAELIAGQWYVNIHTDTHPGGEIRGSVVKGM
jgi:CHRD domain